MEITVNDTRDRQLLTGMAVTLLAQPGPARTDVGATDHRTRGPPGLAVRRTLREPPVGAAGWRVLLGAWRRDPPVLDLRPARRL